MTTIEAAGKLGLSAWTTRRKCALGQIAAIKIHGDWEISEHELQSYLRIQKMRGANGPALELMKRGIAP